MTVATDEIPDRLKADLRRELVKAIGGYLRGIMAGAGATLAAVGLYELIGLQAVWPLQPRTYVIAGGALVVVDWLYSRRITDWNTLENTVERIKQEVSDGD